MTEQQTATKVQVLVFKTSTLVTPVIRSLFIDAPHGGGKGATS